MAVAEHVQAGLDHHRAGRLDDAAREYGFVLTEDPSNVAVLRLMGILHTHRGDHEQAVMVLQAAAALEPGAAEIFNDLGLALRAKGDEPCGARCIQRCAPSLPDVCRGAFQQRRDARSDGCARTGGGCLYTCPGGRCGPPCSTFQSCVPAFRCRDSMSRPPRMPVPYASLIPRSSRPICCTGAHHWNSAGLRMRRRRSVPRSPARRNSPSPTRCSVRCLRSNTNSRMPRRR